MAKGEIADHDQAISPFAMIFFISCRSCSDVSSGKGLSLPHVNFQYKFLFKYYEKGLIVISHIVCGFPTPLLQATFENIVTKGEIVQNEQFLLLPVFSTLFKYFTKYYTIIYRDVSQLCQDVLYIKLFLFLTLAVILCSLGVEQWVWTMFNRGTSKVCYCEFILKLVHWFRRRSCWRPMCTNRQTDVVHVSEKN